MTCPHVAAEPFWFELCYKCKDLENSKGVWNTWMMFISGYDTKYIGLNKTLKLASLAFVMWQIENYKLYLGWYCPVFSSWHLFHGIAVIYWEGKAYGNTILLKGMLNQPRSWGSRSDSGGLDRLDEYGHWKANGFEEIYIVQPGAKSKEVTNQVLISVKKFPLPFTGLLYCPYWARH